VRAVVAAAVVTAAVPAVASADTHGTVAIGGGLLLTGDDGELGRGDVQVDFEPRGGWGRYGVLLAWRDLDASHAGLVCGGVVFDAAASRPRLALQFHGDVGVDLDVRRPLVGGGLRTVVGIAGPLGVVLDTAGELVIDGDATRFALSLDALVAIRW
jgi:hypothetical protein